MPFPSGPTYTSYANYIVFFSDQAEYDSAIALAGGTLVDISPAAAATLLGVPFPPVGGPLSESKGLIAVGLWSFAEPGTEVLHPNPSGVFLSPSVASVVVPGQPGNPSSVYPTGPAMTLIWTALIIKVGGDAPSDPAELVVIPQRRWIGGFEFVATGEGPGFSAIVGCRDSSRTCDGLGWAIRSDANVFWSRAVAAYDTTLQTNASWERFYIKLRTLPSTEVIIWNSHGTPTATSGGRLSITTLGEIKIYNVNAGVPALLGTTAALGLNVWHKIDILVTYNNSAGTGHAGGGASVTGDVATETNLGLDVGPGSTGSIAGSGINTVTGVALTRIDANSVQFAGLTTTDPVLALVSNKTWSTTNSGAGGSLEVYIDGVGVGIFAVPTASGGLGSASSRHLTSALGTEGMGAWTGEIDLDDWINSAIPADEDFPASLDSFVGSHVQKLWNTAFAADMSGWAGVGGFNTTNQMNNPASVTATGRLTSSTSGARLSVVTDENIIPIMFTGISIGPLAVLIAVYASKGGAPNGTLGYSILGNTAVMVSITQPGAATWNTVMYRPSGLTEPADIGPLNIIYDKAADATLSTEHALQSIIERIGSWGLEDDPDGLPAFSLVHNAYYPNTEWAYNGPVPDGPVCVIGGTYTGNATFQSIDLALPCHFLWIRPLTSGTTGVKWFGAGLGGHPAGQENVFPEFVVRVFADDTGQVKFTVAGNHSQVNASAVVYQYIAFCDPGMRYNICGAFKHAFGVTTAANALVDLTFTPNGVWIQNDYLAASTTVNLLYKGPGATANTGTKIDGTSVTNFGSFAAGLITSRADAHFLNSAQANYSAFRTTDAAGYVAVQIMTYTGNAVNPRTITLTPTSEQVPLFVIVFPRNGNAVFFRDPSHTGSNSSDASAGTNSTLAITGRGVDSITINSALNVNTILYDVFAFPGGDGTNGTWYPPNGPPPGPWPPVPPAPPPADIAITAEGGLVLDSSASILMLEDVSGIYTLVPGKTDDTVYDRQTGQTSVDMKIPDPNAKTGFVGN